MSRAPESCPDDLMKMLQEIHPPITMVEPSYQQRVYECVTDFFEIREKKAGTEKSKSWRAK
jgi:hypothetical protein